MRRVMVVLAMLLMVSCAADTTTSTRQSKRGTLTEYQYTLKDGQKVTCLVYLDGYAGGLSCDWGGAGE